MQFKITLPEELIKFIEPAKRQSDNKSTNQSVNKNNKQIINNFQLNKQFELLLNRFLKIFCLVFAQVD